MTVGIDIAMKARAVLVATIRVLQDIAVTGIEEKLDSLYARQSQCFLLFNTHTYNATKVLSLIDQ